MKISFSQHIIKLLKSSNIQILDNPESFKNKLLRKFPDKSKKVKLLYYGLLNNIPKSQLFYFDFNTAMNLSGINKYAYPRYYDGEKKPNKEYMFKLLEK